MCGWIASALPCELEVILGDLQSTPSKLCVPIVCVEGEQHDRQTSIGVLLHRLGWSCHCGRLFSHVPHALASKTARNSVPERFHVFELWSRDQSSFQPIQCSKDSGRDEHANCFRLEPPPRQLWKNPTPNCFRSIEAFLCVSGVLAVTTEPGTQKSDRFIVQVGLLCSETISDTKALIFLWSNVLTPGFHRGFQDSLRLSPHSCPGHHVCVVRKKHLQQLKHLHRVISRRSGPLSTPTQRPIAGAANGDTSVGKRLFHMLMTVGRGVRVKDVEFTRIGHLVFGCSNESWREDPS